METVGPEAGYPEDEMLRKVRRGAWTVRRCALVGLLVGLPLALAPPIGAKAQQKPPITAAQLGVIEDMVAGSLGHEQALVPQTKQLLGLQSDVARQMSGSDDPSLNHFFNVAASDPGKLLLSTSAAGTVRAYLVDSGNLHYMRGYVSNNGRYTMLAPQQGATQAAAELAWWGKAAATVIEQSKKALAAGKSADDVAKTYGVSADTLKKWLAAAG
jgi:hypothetical protein